MSKSYCHIYCQMRGGEGVPGDAMLRNCQQITDPYRRFRGFDKNRGAIFGRRGAAAAVRSEAEDERPSPAASNPTLSAGYASAAVRRRSKRPIKAGKFLKTTSA